MSIKNVVMSAAGATTDKTYIEDVFSTYLYTGNGSTQTINNGIDLAGKGGMVWIKNRSYSTSNRIYDTARGSNSSLSSNGVAGAYSPDNGVTSFLSNGFTLGSFDEVNFSPYNYASWTFRKAPKFFDVVTYTGNGAGYRTLNHNLGSVPGMVIVKRTDSSSNWWVFHKGSGDGTGYYNANPNTGGNPDCGILNSTSSFTYDGNLPGLYGGMTTTVSMMAGTGEANASGATYVAYLFAHDTTTDGLIQCGSYTGNGSATGPVVNLGWEPQYVLIKGASLAQDWFVADTMRGMPVGSGDVALSPNSSSAEMTGLNYIAPTATGFQINSAGSSFNGDGETYIYMAIRRGPMRTPTDGTTVFKPYIYTGTGGSNVEWDTGFSCDSLLSKGRSQSNLSPSFVDRLRGNDKILSTGSTGAESSNGWIDIVGTRANNIIVTPDSASGNITYTNSSGQTYVDWMFRRAPGFFDVVCYTGTGAARTVNHNLGVAPELMIVKSRSQTFGWKVYSAPTGASSFLTLEATDALATGSYWNNSIPTSTQFSLEGFAAVNNSNNPYVAYLFASCPGVSKVGSYTAPGSTAMQINCGFTNGARFVLIKRTDSTGDWYVYDTARGIVSAGNDPYLFMNSTAAEVTNTNYIQPLSNGFQVNGQATNPLGLAGATYIYLAIA